MNLEFKDSRENSCIILTDFSCADGRQLLKEKGLYKIIWAKEDIKDIMIDGYRYEFDQNQLIFCTPLNVIEIPHGHRKLISIVFNREFYCIRDNDEEVSCNGFLFYGSSSPTLVMLGNEEEKDFENIYNIIKDELIKKNQSLAEMLRAMLKRHIIKSNRLLKLDSNLSGNANEKFEFMRRFNILVEKNYKKLHKLTEYANLLNKSPKTVSNIFSAHSDFTPLQMINERIFVEARRLVLYSNKSINEIASILGYKDAGHFSKFFKKNAGVSPLKFKKEMNNRKSEVK